MEDDKTPSKIMVKLVNQPIKPWWWLDFQGKPVVNYMANIKLETSTGFLLAGFQEPSTISICNLGGVHRFNVASSIAFFWGKDGGHLSGSRFCIADRGPGRENVT